MLTAQEIDDLKVTKEKELKEAKDNLFQVELKVLELSKQIIDLQAQKKKYQIDESKAKHIVSTLSLDIKILISQFWSAKNGGL